MSRGMVGLAVLATVGILAGEAVAGDSAVVVMYHRFGDSRYPTTNIRIEQFEEHIAELKSGPYHVLPLGEIIAAQREGRPLPDRTVAITIDDAFLTVYKEAWPRFKKAGLPFTYFVTTDDLDRGTGDSMGWPQLREMIAGGGVTVGHHSAAHVSFAKEGPERAQAEIEKASTRFQAELGQVPEIFSYPYGEAGLAEREVVAKAGFKAAFGQQSGAFDSTDDRFFLPRFALNETYGTIDRFRLYVNTLALPVSDATPDDSTIKGANPPAIGFSVGLEAGNLNALACYSSFEGSVGLIRLGENRFEVRLQKPLPTGRSRLNCTLPARDGRWYWYGRQFYLPAH